MNMLKNWLTEADNATFCLVRALGGTAAISMIYKFIASASADYQGFAIGMGAILTAVAIKNATER